MVTRSDPSFKLPAGVEQEKIREGRTPDDGVSFSGHERDYVFMNLGDGQFKDVSGVSGANDPGDGRGFALLDFDRDGWWDIASINANAPSLKLYQNRFGADPEWRAAHNVIALRFVGANHRAEPAKGLSNRDGFGAVVTIDLGDRKLTRQHRAGEGFATQNSTTMLVGIDAAKAAKKVTVRWPSGKTQTLEDVAANRLVTVREPGSDAAAPFEIAEYAPSDRVATGPPTAKASAPTRLSIDVPEDAVDPDLRVFTTFASWCQSCRADVRQFQRLREVFPPTRLGLFSVPADEDDDRAKLEEWMTTQRPPYRMLFDLPGAQLAALKRLLVKQLKREALPSTVVTNRSGEVLKTMLGVPTVSDIRMLGTGTPPPDSH